MKPICQGKSVTQGVAIGKIVVVSESAIPFDEIDKSCILLLENSCPVYAILIMNAGGVIIKEGSILAHSCLLAIEMGIPCITQVGKNISIESGKTVLLDAGAGELYEHGAI